MDGPAADAPEYMITALAIHAEMLHRLADGAKMPLLAWGEIMEDIGNLYLDIADRVRETVIEARQLAILQHPPLSDG
jgi:hypothetical protein